jgi:hypothetical protein
VLFIPHIFRGAFKAKRIGICWDGSRLAARALRDARPFLAQADRLLAISISGADSMPAEASGDKLAKHLALAGLPVRVIKLSAARANSAFRPVGGSRRESRNAGNGSLRTFAPAGRDPGRCDPRDAGHHDGTDADVSLRHNFQYARISSEVIK